MSSGRRMLQTQQGRVARKQTTVWWCDLHHRWHEFALVNNAFLFCRCKYRLRIGGRSGVVKRNSGNGTARSNTKYWFNEHIHPWKHKEVVGTIVTLFNKNKENYYHFFAFTTSQQKRHVAHILFTTLPEIHCQSFWQIVQTARARFDLPDNWQHCIVQRNWVNCRCSKSHVCSSQ